MTQTKIRRPRCTCSDEFKNQRVTWQFEAPSSIARE